MHDRERHSDARVSEDDRRAMAELREDLEASQTHERGGAAQRRAVLDWVNERRAASGREPLVDDEVPEEGLYERIRSLGMARVDPRGPRRA